MKARVKATGRVVTITGTDGICLIDENGNYHLIRDLEGCEIIPDYWEKLKHQYAGMAMHALLTNTMIAPYKSDEIAKMSDRFATELVNKLKEESQCEK